MSNEQLAHDLAVARMAGKQLPAEALIKEYRSNYQAILDCLNAEPRETVKAEIIKGPI